MFLTLHFVNSFFFFLFLVKRTCKRAEWDGWTVTFSLSSSALHFSNQGHSISELPWLGQTWPVFCTHRKKKYTRNCRITPHRDTSNFYLPWHLMAVCFFLSLSHLWKLLSTLPNKQGNNQPPSHWNLSAKAICSQQKHKTNGNSSLCRFLFCSLHKFGIISSTDITPRGTVENHGDWSSFSPLF